MLAPFLPLLMQIGPAPSPLVLPDLPIPRARPAENAPGAAAAPLSAAASEAIAGNQAVVAGDYPRALALFRSARAKAAGLPGGAQLGAGIALDEARALVALDRAAEALPLLAEARAVLAGDVEAWTVSALAARRAGDLAQAQAFIEKAVERAPGNAAAGLEAGLIAYYAGRPDAARTSWESVRTTSPDSPEAVAATRYLAALTEEEAAR